MCVFGVWHLIKCYCCMLQPTVSLTLTGIRLMVLNNTFPQYYLLELHGRNLDYSEQVVYVNDQASCEGVTLPCNQFSVEDNVIYLPFIANMSQVLCIVAKCVCE